MDNPDSKEGVKQKAIKGILWGGLSNGTVQVLGLIFGIYISRNLSDKEYAVYGLLTVFSLIASKIQESGFINALANKKEIDFKDYNAVFWFNIGLSSILYTILYISAPYIASYFNIPELTLAARVLFLSFVFGSFGIVHSAYLFKTLQVKERALATTISVFIAGIVAVVLVYYNFSYWSLVYQALTYSITFTIICTLNSKFRPSFQIDFSPIKEMWKFSSMILANNIIDVLNNNLLTLYLGRFFNKDVVGNYTQAYKWGNMTQSIIANMSHGFAQPLLAKFQNDRERQNFIFLKLLELICFMSFPALALLCIIAKEFIIITITEKWNNAVPILQIICLSSAFLPLINYYSNYFLSRGASKTYMIHNTIFGLSQIVILLLMRHEEMLKIVWVISIFTCVWAFVWQISISRATQIKYLSLVKLIAKNLFPSVAIAVVVYYSLGYWFSNLYLLIITKIIAFGSLYLLIQYLMKSSVLNEIFNLLKAKVTHAKKI